MTRKVKVPQDRRHQGRQGDSPQERAPSGERLLRFLRHQRTQNRESLEPGTQLQVSVGQTEGLAWRAETYVNVPMPEATLVHDST